MDIEEIEKRLQDNQARFDKQANKHPELLALDRQLRLLECHLLRHISRKLEEIKSNLEEINGTLDGIDKELWRRENP